MVIKTSYLTILIIIKLILVAFKKNKTKKIYYKHNNILFFILQETKIYYINIKNTFLVDLLNKNY